MPADDIDPREWAEATSDADPATQMAVLCLLAGRRVTLDADDLRGSLRRAELLLAAGGDPRRPLDLDGRAVSAVATDLDDPDARAQLAAGLIDLARELHDLERPTEQIRLLAEDADLAWQCFAMALLGEALADEI